MKLIRIISAIVITAGMIYFYPYLHTMITAISDVATTMFPGMTVMQGFFFDIMPIAVLGIIVWWGISTALGKMTGQNEGG